LEELGTIQVLVNGEKLSLPDGATVQSAIDTAEAPYKIGASVGILKKSESVRSESVREYRVKTTKGELRLEIIDHLSASARRWMEDFRQYEGISLRWGSKDATAFGPFSESLKPERNLTKLDKYDVAFSAGGYNPSNFHLLFSLAEHSADYGAPEDGPFARVVGGKKLLTSFERSDRILEIEPVIEWQESAKHLVTDDTNTILEDGDGLFTFIMVELALESPEGAEFFFGLIKDGFFEVDYESSSFISDTSLKGEICSFENFEARKDGAVWVRTAGYGTGKVFISRDERTASVVHSVIGHIQQGIELIHMAGKGHSIFVKTDPAPINILGMGFKEAEKHLEGLGVELVREGYKEDDANIVKLNPSSTIDILLAKKVIATGAPDSLVIRVELYDELAPKSVDFFRHAVGLTFRPIGTLPVMMIYEDTYLFKAAKSAEKYKEILPENVLVDKTKAFEIGITNQAAKRMGIVGVKTEDDDLFGPTGEKFSSTNIIGKILEPEKFKALTEKDTMYVLESNKEEIE